jgi:hypothetical protein
MRHFFQVSKPSCKRRSKERCKCIEIVHSSRNSKVVPSTNREAKDTLKKRQKKSKDFQFPPSNPKIGTRDETPPQQPSDCEMNQKKKTKKQKSPKKEINR